MAMSANAQSMKHINKEVTAKTWVETATPQKAAKKIATRAGELEANQRYVISVTNFSVSVVKP